MITSPLLHALSGARFQFTAIGLALLGAASPVQAVNLLVDSSFESLPLDTLPAVYGGNFITGIWGTESGTVTSSVGGVSPDNGTLMLSMTADGVTAQTIQITDLTSYASGIDAGTETYELSALFNAGVSGTSASVIAAFFTGSNSGTANGITYGNLLLDDSGKTWESLSISGMIPANTRWLVSQVTYSSASLGANAGYVDSVSLTVGTIPEPSSYALLGFGACGLLVRRRR